MHRPLSEDEFVNHLTNGSPVALAFLRLEADRNEWTWTYHQQVKFIVLDFDLKLPDIPDSLLPEVKSKMHDAIVFLHRRMDLYGLSPGLTHSGSKGNHLWVILDEEIDLGYLLGFFRDICRDVPHFVQHGNRYVLRGMDGTIYAEIDSLYKTGDGALIKAPFSMHQNRPGYYELPISIDDLRTYEPVENPGPEVFAAAAALVRDEWAVIPSNHITIPFPCLAGGERTGGAGRPRSRIMSNASNLEIPEPGDFEEEMAEIDSWADPDSPIYLPCFGFAVAMSLPPKRSRFNLRTVVARLIVNRMEALHGIDKSVGKRLAALYIRTRINDDEDNRHPETLVFQVNYWTDNFPRVVNYCSNLALDGAVFKCCPGPCGRSSPLEDTPHRGGVLDIPRETNESLDAVLDTARRRRHHVQLFKTTRAGGTSTITANTIANDERLVIVVPTTKIAQTIETALALAPNGGTKVGALLPGNAEACLKLKKRIQILREDFAGEEPALLGLPQLRKYPCSQCQFRGCYLPVEGGAVLQESDLDAEQCLWTTIVDNLDDIDVLVITHKKLNALKMAAEAASENDFITTIIDAERILGWISRADVILLDEISMMIDQPDMDLELLWDPVDRTAISRDIMPLLEEDLEQLSRWRNDYVMEAIDGIIENLTSEFEAAKLVNGIEVYERGVDAVESAHLADLLQRVQQYALNTNRALWRLFNALLMSHEGEWVVLEAPDQDARRNVRVYIRPKFRAGVSEILLGSRARVIAMDATMPLAASQNLDRIMRMAFQRVNIGDPQRTAELMRIVPWPYEVKSPKLNSFVRDARREDDGLLSRRLDQELLGTIMMMDELWGMENCIIAVPSKRVATYVRWLCRGRVRDLDIMWHRSSESVGVANDKRVMLGITAPFAPRGALNWLKEVIYPDMLADMSNDDLWRYDQHKTNYQTISRVKDPRFDPDPENHQRSVFIAFGMPPFAVESMRMDVVAPPQALPAAQVRALGATERWVAPVLTAHAWQAYGVALTEADQHAAYHLWHGRDASWVRHNVPRPPGPARVLELAALVRSLRGD
jgi:hypothetical protein